MIRRRLVIAVFSCVLAFLAACSRDPAKLKARYVASGDRYVAEKKYSEAIIEYRNALTQDAKFGEARYKIGLAYEAAGDPRNALSEYVRAADLMPDHVEAQLHAGRLLLETRQYAEAKARALAVLAKEPRNIDGLTLMGNSLAGLKDYEGAISQIEEAIDTDPRRTLTYTNLGLLQLFKGNKSAAEDAFKRAVEIDPKSVSAHMSLANYYWAAGDGAQAEREIKSAFAIDPKSIGVNRALAALYLTSARAPEAEPYLKNYAEAMAQVTPKLVLADYYLALGKTKEATEVLEPLTKEGEGFAPAGVRLASIDYQAGRRAEGYKTLEGVLARQPKNEAAILAKARFLLNDQKFTDALKLTKSVVDANPQSVAGHFWHGAALEGAGSLDEAAKEFLEVLRLQPSVNAAAIKLGSLALARGDAAAAVEFSNQALKNDPNSSIAQYVSATALLRLGKLASAEPKIAALAKTNPRSADVHILTGDLYRAKGDLTHAGESYSRALELKDTSVEALTGLVKIDLVQKKPEAARSKIEAHLAKAPDNAALLLLAGRVFLTVGDKPRAESLYRHVLDVDQSNMEAYDKLAGIYLSESRLDEARREYEEVARLQPKVAPVATTMVGIILSLQNKQDEARKHYEQALALNPRAAVAANNLAWTYAESGENLDTALKLAQTAREQLPNNWEVSDTLGWVYYKRGLATLAISALREGTQQSPTNPVVHYHLGLAYLKNGDRSQAERSLKHALQLDPTFKDAADAKQTLAIMKGS
jgi:tetratricopeptide (TPR) repeat protein